MRVRETVNDYGKPVIQYRCGTCSDLFTVCPPPDPEEDDRWRGCLAPTCASYDPARDADRLFDAGEVVRRGERRLRVIDGGAQPHNQGVSDL